MIPLYKLENLPRLQRLRKIAKFFLFAENRFIMSAEKKAAIFSAAELVFFSEAASLLAKDELFSRQTRIEFTRAADVFKKVLNWHSNDTRDFDMDEFLRAVNSVKHLLLTETGRDQADWDFTAAGRLDAEKRRVFPGMTVYLEDIRSPFNVGAMFRTAESFGVEKIFMSPFCADPRHRRAQRTAMGCVDIVPWERREFFNEPPDFDASLPVFALETGGIPLAEFPFPERGLIITGSEELGVSPQALAAADASLGRVSIPIYGAKASLNVSVAFGIALEAWGRILTRRGNED